MVDGTLRLSGLEFFSDLDGLTFAELPRTFARRIEETKIIAYIVKDGTPANVKYNIFKIINTGGLEITPQEIRHALYQGAATQLCKRFADFHEFKTAITYSIRDNRMMDQEFVLRFVAVCYYGIDKYEGGKNASVLYGSALSISSIEQLLLPLSCPTKYSNNYFNNQTDNMMMNMNIILLKTIHKCTGRDI